MSQTAIPAAGFITQTPVPSVQTGTQWFEDLRNAASQGLGQAADGSAIVIAGGVIAPTLASHVVDTEGGAGTDDLANIDPTGIPDGRIVVIRSADPARVVTVKHGAGGTGQILLADVTDYVLAAIKQFICLKLKSGVWEEQWRAVSADLGTASKKNTGTTSGTIPLLGSQGLPAISGELLTDVPRFGNFAPSQQSTPNMTLKLSAGSLQIGTALVKVASQNTSTITAPITNPRYDIVHIDPVTGAVGVAAGAENASPADPAIPAGKLPIARLRLATTQTSINSADFDDIRHLLVPTVPTQIAITGFLPTAISGTSTTAAITFSAGQAIDSTGVAVLAKTSTTSWAVSNGNAINGYQGGATLPNSSTIHFYFCVGSSGSGFFASTSLTPTIPSGYTTYFRRAVSLPTNASGVLLGTPAIETSGGAALIYLATQILDINATAPTANRTLAAISVPTGIKVRVLGRGGPTSTTANTVIFTSPDEADVAPASSTTTVPGYDAVSTSTIGAGTMQPFLTTDTSGRIGYRGTVAVSIGWTTRGWVDFRRT